MKDESGGGAKEVFLEVRPEVGRGSGGGLRGGGIEEGGRGGVMWGRLIKHMGRDDERRGTSIALWKGKGRSSGGPAG
eukprot:CAMPEP_0184676024 /NCGR_PEP_ID=MMETSP0308-20130426/88129_1 /TAXON_ID=38269 /ORGANISM="Gloeochaete witrockiana, Strain SAG 46.84" /LENGTH=76 /DNA_ID=CAMNT_0027123825 /DNA_START=1395 /DNA_END=1624 /DNA_ORIENTATION=+